MALVGALPSMRAMYGARKGWQITHADVSQGELRTMYAVTGDEVLGAALKSGDVYTEDAKAIFDLPAHWTKKDLKPEARKASKEVHLAFQYGAGLPTVMKSVWKRDLTISAETIALAFDVLRRRYERTVAWWSEEMERVFRVGYSETRLMFRRQVYPRQPELSMVANYPNQGTLADHVNLWFLELDEALERFFKKHRKLLRISMPPLRQGVLPEGIIIQLHDAVDVEHPPELKDEVVGILKETGEVPRLIEGKEHVFPLEIKTGELWSEV